MVMSLKACSCNLRASATHSCESQHFRSGGTKGLFALPDVSHLSLGLRQKKKNKQDGLGMSAHVILHKIHVERFWPQS